MNLNMNLMHIKYDLKLLDTHINNSYIHRERN